MPGEHHANATKRIVVYVDSRTHLAPASGLSAWFKSWARLRRARGLFASGQALTAHRGPSAQQRSARLYRRALQLIAVPTDGKTNGSGLDRLAARDLLRSELRRRSLLGLARAHPGTSKVLVSAGVLLLLASAATRWLSPDLAAGKRWHASSAWGAFPRTGLMVGEAPIDGRFHTREEQDPWVVLDLGETQRVHAVRVENRTNCCKERATPLAFELSVDNEHWKLVGYRRVPFGTYTQQFEPQQARYLRLRVDRHSVLHLRRISVY